VLGGGVAGAARVDLEAGDGAEVDDVGVGAARSRGRRLRVTRSRSPTAAAKASTEAGSVTSRARVVAPTSSQRWDG
jgi:hypothetical protein